MRLIDADAFEVVTTKLPDGMDAESYMAGVGFVLNKIDDAPTIEERKKGKWIVHLYKLGLERFECDQCHGRSGLAYDFCPNCGADMRGGRDD